MYLLVAQRLPPTYFGYTAYSALSNHVTYCCILSLYPVFGSFRSIWSMLRSYFIQTEPEFIWKWIETKKMGLGLLPYKLCCSTLVWCTPGFGWQRSHFLKWTTLTEQSHPMQMHQCNSANISSSQNKTTNKQTKQNSTHTNNNNKTVYKDSEWKALQLLKPLVIKENNKSWHTCVGLAS